MVLVLSHTGHTSTVMRSAVVILSMVAAIAAEAPYHLPRPAAHAPSFSYSAAPAPPPPPPPHPYPHHHPHPHPHPQPQFIQYPPQPAPAPQFIQGSGYQYQQPNLGQPAPQPHHHVHPHPPPVPPPHFTSMSYPQQQFSQPPPQPIPQSPPSYTYAQPAPAPRPQAPPAPLQPAPLPAYMAPQPAPVAVPLPAYIAPQAQPAPTAQPVSHYQPQVQQGYSYQHPQIQYVSQLPLQSQPLQSQTLQTQPLQTQSLISNVPTSALSSYQADTNQYNSASLQSHSEALDATVVDRVQNIIKENEHTSARDAGYLSLVSGVSLEQARPSIEISSFVHNSPLRTSQSSEHGSIEQSSSHQLSASAAASAASPDYGLPEVTANSQAPAPAPQPDATLSFLPQNKPASSYGTPQ